jgi:hypothetical protein
MESGADIPSSPHSVVVMRALSKGKGIGGSSRIKELDVEGMIVYLSLLSY